jgi:hypothetical protein
LQGTDRGCDESASPAAAYPSGKGVPPTSSRPSAPANSNALRLGSRTRHSRGPFSVVLALPCSKNRQEALKFNGSSVSVRQQRPPTPNRPNAPANSNALRLGSRTRPSRGPFSVVLALPRSKNSSRSPVRNCTEPQMLWGSFSSRRSSKAAFRNVQPTSQIRHIRPSRDTRRTAEQLPLVLLPRGWIGLHHPEDVPFRIFAIRQPTDAGDWHLRQRNRPPARQGLFH